MFLDSVQKNIANARQWPKGGNSELTRKYVENCSIAKHITITVLDKTSSNKFYFCPVLYQQVILEAVRKDDSYTRINVDKATEITNAFAVNDNFKVPNMYMTPKLHKPLVRGMYKLRPIVSACDCYLTETSLVLASIYKLILSNLRKKFKNPKRHFDLPFSCIN